MAVPNEFSAGTLIQSSQVNENFENLDGRVNVFEELKIVTNKVFLLSQGVVTEQDEFSTGLEIGDVDDLRDNDLNTFNGIQQSTGNVAGTKSSYLTFDFGKKYKIARLCGRFTYSRGNSGANRSSNGGVQYSSDNSNWTTIDSLSSNYAYTASKFFDISAQNVRYFRVWSNADQNSTSTCKIDELSILTTGESYI